MWVCVCPMWFVIVMFGSCGAVRIGAAPSFHYRWPAKNTLNTQVYTLHIYRNRKCTFMCKYLGPRNFLSECARVCVSILFDSRYFHSKNNKDVVISSINFWSGFNNFICSLSLSWMSCFLFLLLLYTLWTLVCVCAAEEMRNILLGCANGFS